MDAKLARWVEVKSEPTVKDLNKELEELCDLEGKILSIDWAPMIGKKYDVDNFLVEVRGIEEDLKVILHVNDKRITLFEVVYDNVYSLNRDYRDIIRFLLES